MNEWAAKRFWTNAEMRRVAEGYGLYLDGRAVKTPGRRVLIMPSEAMASAAVAEWAAQNELIDPNTMPVTKSANSALDQTGPQRAAVIEMLASYAETDLLCHRATQPASLVARQMAAWDPWLAWAEDQLCAALRPTHGIIALDQPPESLARLRAAVAAFGDFGLTGLYDLIQISGSLVLGLAVAKKALPAEQGWLISRIDEDHQISQWGADSEAEARAEARKTAFLHAARIVHWSGSA
ncbi:MAG: ATP12 family protein [Pseudomonadota bacterium]